MVDIEKRRNVPPEVFPVKFAPTVRNFFNEVNCGSPLFPRLMGGVLTVSSNVTPLDALQKLIDSKFLSVVVIDENTKKPIGFFSMQDMLNILINNVSATEVAMAAMDHSFASWKRAEFALKPIVAFQDSIGKMEPVIEVRETQPLRDAVQLMVKNQASRVLVVDSFGNLSNIITCTRVLHLITTMVDTLPYAQKTLRELNLGFKEVFSVRDNIAAYFAYHYLRDKKVGALAVVNEDGAMVGVISASDIKLLGYDLKYFGLLQLQVSSYLVELKSVSAPMLLTVSPNDTFATVLLQLYFQYPRVHRVFITDENRKPIGVLSVKDLLAFIAAKELDIH